MITGIVNGRNELIVWLQVQDILQTPRDIEVVVDTGFTRVLALPSVMVASLGLQLQAQQSMVLADGSILNVNVYRAVLVWDGLPQNILVHAVGDDPLLGTGLLVGHDLRARVEPGGVVEIESIPP